jgi:hypothetical protein
MAYKEKIKEKLKAYCGGAMQGTDFLNTIVRNESLGCLTLEDKIICDSTISAKGERMYESTSKDKNCKIAYNLGTLTGIVLSTFSTAGLWLGLYTSGKGMVTHKQNRKEDDRKFEDWKKNIDSTVRDDLPREVKMDIYNMQYKQMRGFAKPAKDADDTRTIYRTDKALEHCEQKMRALSC